MTSALSIKNKSRGIAPVALISKTPRIIVIVGVTNTYQSIEEEIEKAHTAVKYGAAIIADVSTSGDIPTIHRALAENVSVPLSSVPLYQIYQTAIGCNQWNRDLPKSLVLDCIESQAESGIDCMTVHAGYRLGVVEKVAKSGRKIRVQARGGGLLHEWMNRTGEENPLYRYFDDILDVLRKYNVTLSLGNCLRTGTVEDPIDDIIQLETLALSELTRKAQQRDIGVMVEGLSHIRYDMINAYVKWVKAVCHGAPIRLLGPLGTERGLGHDHITAAICSVEAVKSGTDFLTCITRAEHIGLPTAEDIRESVVSLRIALELAGQSSQDSIRPSNFTCGLGFENLRPDDVFDLEKAVELKLAKNGGSLSTCSMCSQTCRIRINPLAKTHLPTVSATGERLILED